MNRNSIKVLLVEDDEDDYVLTSELLKDVVGTEYEITWAPNYASGLAAMLGNQHDVCLVDYRLGEGTGIELLSEAIENGCRLPMILLTGQGDHEIDMEATRAGAADFLVKGALESTTLERAIRYAVARAKTLESLRESDGRFRSVVESANDAIILIDKRGEIVSWNRTARTIFGYEDIEIMHRPIVALFPDTYADTIRKMEDCDPMIIAGLVYPGCRATELLGKKKDGSEFPLEITISSWETAKGPYYSAIIRDSTQRKSLENQLTEQALHDPLTKLANRILFKDRVEHALSGSNRKNSHGAVLFLDLDNFKNVNDTLGHEAGDSLLISVAARIRSCLRAEDTAARLGGDEFAVLLQDTTRTDGGKLVAERILESLRLPFSIAGKELFIGSSIGIAESSDSVWSPDDLLRNADVAMYIAKTTGKNRYVVFENKMHETLIKRAEIETELRHALEYGEFEMRYQPIVSLLNNEIIAMEALVRWNHPRRITIGPDEFMPIAEESNMLEELGAWILLESCTQAAAWQREFPSVPPIELNVNISNRQFQDEKFVATVAAAIETSNLLPRSLILEITERTMLIDTEATIAKMQAIKDLGVRLAIDDFGTGYSALSYLHRFPIDVLKIDKSFIEKIDDGKEGLAMARAIISMSESLRLDTIAEGIENPDQIKTLMGLGCERGQGYHYAVPLDRGEMDKYLRRSFAGLVENGSLFKPSTDLGRAEPVLA